MSMITPIDSNANTQVPYLTAYWNTETKAYAIAYIPVTENTSTEDNVFHSLAMLIPHLRDEAINLRLVCKAFAHPSLRDFYLQSPIDPPRQSPEMNVICFQLIQRIMASKAHLRYSNPMIDLKRSLSLQEFRAFQFHFPTIKTLPRLVLKEPLLSIDHFPSARTVTLSYCDPVSNTLSAFPNIEQFRFTNPDKTPPVLKDWDPLFEMQPVNSLLHLRQIEFEFTPAYGFFSQQGLEALIRSAPNLATIIYTTDKMHITAQELRVLQTNHPHIEFRNLAAYL